MRLIDADELRKQWSADDACECDYTHLHFLESIDSAPTIEERKTEWHTYPQEKPKDLNDKLVTIRESDRDRYTTIGFFDEGQWRGKNEFWIPNNIVTAWAELPKPYEGSETE